MMFVFFCRATVVVLWSAVTYWLERRLGVWPIVTQPIRPYTQGSVTSAPGSLRNKQRDDCILNNDFTQTLFLLQLNNRIWKTCIS